MRKNETIESILGEITPEKEEKWKQERIERRNKLTTSWQLGWYVGQYIVHTQLPTLSTDMIKSRNIINVSEEDEMENKRLDKEWFETSKFEKTSNFDEKLNKEKWELFYQHNKMLDRKYLPNPLKCTIPSMKIEDEKDFKKGLSYALFDSDICSYNVNVENIKIYDDEDYYFTIIELSLDADLV